MPSTNEDVIHLSTYHASTNEDVTGLLREIDRLVDWYEKNRPSYKGPLMLPRVWRGKRVRNLVPKFAAPVGDGKWVFRRFPLAIQGDTLPRNTVR